MEPWLKTSAVGAPSLQKTMANAGVPYVIGLGIEPSSRRSGGWHRRSKAAVEKGGGDPADPTLCPDKAHAIGNGGCAS